MRRRGARQHHWPLNAGALAEVNPEGDPLFVGRATANRLVIAHVQRIGTRERGSMHRVEGVRFAVKALPGDGAKGEEFMRAMAPHPLVHQELPYDPEFGLYNGRLVAQHLTSATPEEMYWTIRRKAVLRHTGELPLEIRGADAERFLDLVFTRDVSKVRVGRCSYQFACYHDGGMITDGVLVRLANDRFWFAQADGDLFSWLKAHARGMDVDVTDPGVWISQVQGPESLKILEAAVDDAYPEPFRYFDAARVRIAGQEILITRTGFTNELGWEFYLAPDIDAKAVGERILEAGKPFGLIPISIFGARRIEAGLLNAGSDFDETTTPFAAGLGSMVNFDKGDFLGREALLNADRRCRTWGMRVEGGVARTGRSIRLNGEPVGQVCTSAWSPFQRCGVALVRMDAAEHGPETRVDVDCIDGQARPGELCETPMYDKERLIPRGKATDIPPMPDT